MFRVLIVEDEVLVRLGLKNSIDWSKFDMSLIADAADGQAAWEIYLREKPDLIITDLKMPVMDGMELITKIREKDRKTMIIILSCLEEFELARKAMSYGVSDYILKLTMTEKEMEGVLRKARDELAQNADSGWKNQTGDLKKDVVKEKFLKDYIFYNIYSLNEFTDLVGKAGLRMYPGRLVVCVMEIDHYEILQSRFDDEQGQLIKSAILNILDEIMGNCGRGEAFSGNDRNFILIFSFQDVSSEHSLFNELNSILGNIKNAISTYLNVYVSFGISSVNNGYASLGKLYKEARKALDQRFFSGSGMFFSNTAAEYVKASSEKIGALRKLAKLSKILSEAEMRDYSIKIDSIADAVPQGKEQIQTSFCRLIQWLSTLLYSRDDDSTDIILQYTEKVRKSETLSEVIEAFSGYIAQTTGELMKKRILSREVAQTLQYIQNNYSQDINLPQVAEHVGLSPNYLGNLFKKELQVNFIEYLNEFRIGKAKELLLGTYLKSYEISERIGFTENTYFCKVFKRVTGMSPNEFRKQLMKEWSEEIENAEL